MADYEKNFDTQSNYGWGLTFNMTGKVPAVNKRIFDKLENAQAFADNHLDSAIPGLLLSVINDEDDKKNGAYFIKKIKNDESDTSSVLIKVGEDTTEIENKLLTLIGEDEGKSVREITDDYLKEWLIENVSGVTESMDTLQEIAQWIQDHPEDVTQMNEQIGEIETTLDGYTPTNTVKNAIDELDKTISDNTVLQEDIVVAGLSTDAGSYSNGDIIPKGTSLYEMFQKILCKELFPDNVSNESATAMVSMNALTLKLNYNNNDVVEVGTLVKLLEGKTNGTSITTAPSKIEGMTWGYSSENNNVVESEDKSILKECTASESDNTYTISATINSGFNADTTNKILTTPEAQTGDGSAILNETDLGCAVEGENKITLNATGASYSYQAEAIDKVYYCSNLGKTNEEKFNEGVNKITGVTEKPINTTSKAVTGKYYYFFGYSEKTNCEDFTSSDIRNLKVLNDWMTIDGDTEVLGAEEKMSSNGKSIVLAWPSKYTLKSFDNGVGADIMPNFTSRGTVKVKTGMIETDYMVYVYPITNGSVVEFKNIKLINT